jgi:hypothetical protein
MRTTRLLAIIPALAALLTIVAPGEGRAADGKDVRVINPPSQPVPVSGGIRITNPASNPIPVNVMNGVQAPATHVSVKPSAILVLGAFAEPGFDTPFFVLPPDGTFGSEFSLPAGMVFVVTDVHVETETAVGGFYAGNVSAPTGTPTSFDRVIWRFKTAGPIVERISIRSGVVYARAPNLQNAFSSASGVNVKVYGYLTRDE